MFRQLSSIPFLAFLLFSFVGTDKDTTIQQEFQGKAYYFSKSKMELGAWGARMSEAPKETDSGEIEKQT